MRLFSYILLFIMLSSFRSLSEENYERLPDGIILQIEDKEGNSQFVKIRIISEKIVQVLNGAKEDLDDPQSLIVIKEQTKEVKWDLADEGNNLILKTAFLKITIDSKTGAVAFHDLSGKVLLGEDVNFSQKIFKPLKAASPLKVFSVAFDQPDHGI